MDSSVNESKGTKMNESRLEQLFNLHLKETEAVSAFQSQDPPTISSHLPDADPYRGSEGGGTTSFRVSHNQVPSFSGYSGKETENQNSVIVSDSYL